MDDRATRVFPGFGGRLRAARARAGLSQGQLHVRSGIPKSRLSRYENDHLLPSLQTLHRIVQALGVSEASLLGSEDAENAFLEVLRDRGIRFTSEEQARDAANLVADRIASRMPRIVPATAT